MTNYRRSRIAGVSYFFTVNLADRSQSLLTDHIALLRSAFEYTRERHPFVVDAIVVLPEHIHTILTLPEGDSDFALRWRLIKTVFSRGLPHGESRSDSRQSKGERGIWQRRYWEHLIRDEADFHGMSITSILIRSSTAWCRVWPIGNIRHFIVTCKRGFCRWIGRVIRMLY